MAFYVRADRVARAWHAGRCAICGSRSALDGDHDHTTGLWRGYLCQRCNTSEGGSRRRVFQSYRWMPPAAILGIVSGLEFDELVQAAARLGSWERVGSRKSADPDDRRDPRAFAFHEGACS